MSPNYDVKQVYSTYKVFTEIIKTKNTGYETFN